MAVSGNSIIKEKRYQMNVKNLNYPIGQFEAPSSFTPQLIADCINQITSLPERLGEAVSGLTNEQLDTPYRPEGWTVRQVVHHCADSHMNAYIRCKLALTEEHPTIKPYNEARWAELIDSSLSVESSLHVLSGLHARWTALLRNLTEQELARTFMHPEHNQTFRLDETIALYAWHGNHHLAHITTLMERGGWAQH